MILTFNQYKPLFQILGRVGNGCAKLLGISAGFYGIYKLWTAEGRSKHPVRGRLILSFFYLLHITAIYLSSLVLMGSVELLSPAVATLFVCAGSFVKNIYDLSLEMYHYVRLSRKSNQVSYDLIRLGFDIAENSNFIVFGKQCMADLQLLQTLIENQKNMDNKNTRSINKYRKKLATQLIRVKTNIDGLINLANRDLSQQKNRLPEIFSKLRILLETREKMRFHDLDRYSKHKTTLFSLSMMIIATSLYFTITATTLPLLPEIMLCLGIASGLSNCIDLWTKITTEHEVNAEKEDQMNRLEQLLEEEAVQYPSFNKQRLDLMMVDLSHLLSMDPQSNEIMSESRRRHIPQFQSEVNTRATTSANHSAEKMISDKNPQRVKTCTS